MKLDLQPVNKPSLDLQPDQSAAVLGHATQQMNPFLGMAKGVGEGALSTMSAVHGIGNAVEGMFGMKPSAGEQELTQKVDQASVAKTPDEQVGKGIEMGVEMGLTGMTKTAKSLTSPNALKAVQSTAETMTKGERVAAIGEGRMAPTITGGGKYVASQTEKQAGNLLQGKLSWNPVKNVPVVKNEIKTAGKEVEQFLGQNGRPVSPDQLTEVFNQKKAQVEAYLSPAQMKDYEHTIEQFTGELGKMSDVNTGTIYKALKNFEQNVTAKLPKGKEALLSDSGSARLEAAKMVRTGIRDMITSMHPEFGEKMFNLTSMYDALDNVTMKAEQIGSFAKRHPILTKGLEWGAGAVGAGALFEGGRELVSGMKGGGN